MDKKTMRPNSSFIKAVVLVILVGILLISTNFVDAQTVFGGPPRVFLPIVEKDACHGFASDSKFLGIYMEYYWNNDTVPAYMPLADALAGKKHSVTGWFISLQNIAFTERQNNINENNFYRQMEALWNNGYVSFVNLTSASEVNEYEVEDNCPIPFSAYQVASGACDPAIQKWAELYHQWVSVGGGRRAFLAPFPEMNGVYSDGQPWTSYGGDPVNFKLASQRILAIFDANGVSRDQVWGVFAPHGWSKAGD